MKCLVFCVVVLCFAVVQGRLRGGNNLGDGTFVVSAHADPKPPKYNGTYHAVGYIYIPYAEIVEHFEAHFDAPNKRSRIDYYNSTVETYQRGDLKPFGKNWKVTWETDENNTLSRSCFEVNGTNITTVMPQDILPNITGFTYRNRATYMNVDCYVWQMTQTVHDKKNTYRFWVSTKDNLTPVRYEMIGYNTLLGSHYDKYELIYTEFEQEKIDPDVFDASKSVGKKCTNFPGPGVEADHVMGGNLMAELISGEDDHVHNAFEDFKDQHDKKYKDEAEHETRKNQFRQNLRFIHSKNRAGLGYTLAVNHMADWHDHEFRSVRGRLPSEGYNGGGSFDKHDFDMTSVPDSLDWRLFGSVTPVKDQAICGSCWSFGTTGAVEGAYFLKTNKLVRLSEQALIDCSWGFQNNGCDGGEDFRAYQWILKNGIPTDEDYGPYSGNDGKCHIDQILRSERINITGYVNVTKAAEDAQELQSAIVFKGPISVSIDASQKTFSFYSNGVYYDPKCRNGPNDLDHSVLAVGYGVQNGQPYWLVKNSWSTHWGNDGYVLMSQKDNNCGVQTAATFVNLD